jgi:hypothetical protein
MKSESRRPGEGTGSVVHCGEQREPRPHHPRAQDAPLDAVGVFAPWAGADERALRIRIHRARDSATARATRCKHGDARTIYWIAAQLASARVFARMPNEELKETIDNLARLFLVAGWIERTDSPDAE